MFKVGDEVERIGAFVPSYVQRGKVIRVIPNKDGVDWLTEYEIDFGQFVATLYGSQLQLVKPFPSKAAD